MAATEHEVTAIIVPVRELVEFTAKRGDLDRRFTPAPTGQRGIAGHATVTGRRPDGYEREVALEGRHEELRVRGRADGYDAAGNELEEIKTHRGDSARIPDNHRALHWAQLKVYGALLCRARGLASITLTLVYFRIDDETETSTSEGHEAAVLFEYFEQQAASYLAWARQQQAHRLARNQAIEGLTFPHVEFNAGQRALAAAVYRATLNRQPLLAQAPTGIGKTLGTLFPALKACTRAPIDKLFFLTAKSPGRQVALDALALIQGDQPALRVLELVSRDKSCVHPDKECHGASCPLAQGFYDRLPAARAAAVSSAKLDQRSVQTVAAEHVVCPYYLSQELVRWADVVVGDYNYYFYAHALLHGLTVLNDWKISLLVDEAHNLVDRARDMYSATLDQRALQRARRAAPDELRASLNRVQRRWPAADPDAPDGYQALDTLPSALIDALSDFIAAASRLLGETGERLPFDLQQFFFDAIGLVRLAESFGPHSMVDLSRHSPDAFSTKPGSTLCIRNVVPAPFLGPRFAAAHGAALFSATLNPPDYYRQLLGLADDAPWLDIASPFSADQLSVQIASRISTRFDAREASLAPIVALIAAQYRRQPGNYLAFFSSFDYLDRVLARLIETHPDLPVWAQQRRMDEPARLAFLERFSATDQGIGFAVLGGVFSEGIDLPGARLIGAFVVTLGIPQINPVNEAMRARLETLFGAGYEYAYLYPGLRKVVQAAGRVIRHHSDRGTVVLVDRRYARADVQALLPAWWQLTALQRG
ncbi:ATP-dependent DNA helicase [Nevskia ramosa]|uniref:ATP-dependent DNA helicase n=1 Tax=Nevskia ramosa TaxID=64002 RepID=UPI003D14FA39